MERGKFLHGAEFGDAFFDWWVGHEQFAEPSFPFEWIDDVEWGVGGVGAGWDLGGAAF